LAVSTVSVPDPTVRYAASVLLIGLCGVGLGIVVQLRHLLARPVVAEDQASLTADVAMRVEDARELIAPTALWSLPVVLLFGTELGWWNAASLVLVILGAIAFKLINARTPSSAAIARAVTGVR
jgi:hypothetical protein